MDYFKTVRISTKFKQTDSKKIWPSHDQVSTR